MIACKFLWIIPALLLISLKAQAQETYQYAQRDTCALYLDIYRPADGAPTSFEGHRKPVILFLFGGGFISGSRDAGYFMHWFDILKENGYTVVSIDYRLGMKGVKVKHSLPGLYKASKDFYNAQQIGVEDVFSAVSYLWENSDALGIDASNMVVSGSSAGAIIALASVYDIACGRTKGLPAGFRFKGAMSFAGAIVSIDGAPDWRTEPSPLFLAHGTADKAVAYKSLGAFSRGIWGSSYIAGQMQKKGWDCCILRMNGRTHDVAAYMAELWPQEKEFLEKNVMQGIGRSLDASVDDPSLPSWGEISLGTIYK